MSARRIDVFFYGLFMDADVLRAQGVEPVDPRPAHVEGYALRIGPRATLVPSLGARAYGMLFALTDDDLARLYAAPGLESYRPLEVVAYRAQGDAVSAVCYTLPEPPRADEADTRYAARLQEVLAKVGAPPEYVATIR